MMVVIQKKKVGFKECPKHVCAENISVACAYKKIFGRFIRNLSDFAREEAKKVKEFESRQVFAKHWDRTRKVRHKWGNKVLYGIAWFWDHSFAKIGEDWVFLALLGVLMACLSFSIDYGANLCNKARIWFYEYMENMFLKYLAWISLPVFLVLFSVGFVHLVAPQAIGSGIPEMKTIMRGFVLKEYLTFKTMVAKVVGLTAALGSNMPVGKEGPLVHIASIMATLMSKLITSFRGISENETRTIEMLAAASAVGVACCYAAPIGGVLFSIEVTSVYFAIRNYWRGFFAGVFGAVMYRLLAFWYNHEVTITTIYKTNFQIDYAYDPAELLIYAFIGAFGGFTGALFVCLQRQYVTFIRNNKIIKKILAKNRFIYPFVMTLFIASIDFPDGLGQFLGARMTPKEQITTLFSNFTWTSDDMSLKDSEVVHKWIQKDSDSNLFQNLALFSFVNFFLTMTATTLGMPAGSLIPVFRVGAAFGRAIGEAMATWFPYGLPNSAVPHIIPGGYALAGAAATSAGVTHSLFISVVVCEMTGQFKHIIPVMLSVLISNAIASLLQPSFYDSIIVMKKLPYLPDIIPSKSQAYKIYVQDFMVRDVKYLWRTMTYKQLQQLLKEAKKIRIFPLVDSPESMILIGSIQRHELVTLVQSQICDRKRIDEALRRYKEARERALSAERCAIKSNTNSISSDLVYSKSSPCFFLDSGLHGATPPVEKKKKKNRFEITKVVDEYKKRYDEGCTSLEKAVMPQEHHRKSSIFSLFQIHDSSKHKTSAVHVKSAIKRSNSFCQDKEKKEDSQVLCDLTPNQSLSACDSSRLRQAFESIFRARKNSASGSILITDPITEGLAGSLGKKVPQMRGIDLNPEEREEWEDKELSQTICLLDVTIDPSPFQLVERTPLIKAHSMFSMLNVTHAYVTAIGKLVGVVALKELRKATEDINAGLLRPRLDTFRLDNECDSNKDTFETMPTTTTIASDPCPSVSIIIEDEEKEEPKRSSIRSYKYRACDDSFAKTD
ncbi:chloride channel protein 2-like isoform X1 [Artemia franciscana]|uniref:Chloride channel protein n=1 Tax=Artemia franciscana TaxID=6661 RepID=A0AA88HIF5_ARTSF|nr:hypothetical protein QYM36_013481 [Artemia franciscana]